MKKYIPFCALFTLALYLLYALVMAVFGADFAFFILITAVCILPALIAEIIGRIINAKAHKSYADAIAVYIADVACGVPLAFFIVDDLNSEGFFAGLGGAIALLTIVPLLAASVVVNTVLLIIKARKARQ